MDRSETTDFEASRALGMRIICLLTILSAPVVAGTGWYVGTAPAVALTGALVFAAVGAMALRMRGRTGRIVAAQAITGQCITLNAAMMGHPMQIDIHMVYFAVLAMLMLMSGIRALLVAAGTIAVHHLILTFALPALVYPSTDLMLNIGRTGLHALVVVMETIALGLTIHMRLALEQRAQTQHRDMQAAAERTAAALETAETEKARAESALAEAEAAIAAAARARDEAEAALRRAEDNAHAARMAEETAAEERARHMDEAAHAVSSMIANLEQMSRGNLSVRFTEALPDAYNAGAEAFNAALDRISDTMRQVTQETQSIQAQSGEITQAAGDLSQRTERQAATLSALSTTLSSLTDLVTKVASDANEARTQTLAARDKAHQGGDVMTRAVQAMDAIEASSSEVRKIISVIEDIAFQTNLLALNAGVEAARAGDAGRGFAVVATEVRALASRSSDAAREIDGLINASGQQITEGVQLVKRTGIALGEIKGAVEDIAQGMQTIAEATQRQSRELADVNSGISDLDHVTQQNAAMFEETMAANTALTDNARHLTTLIGRFRMSGAPGTDQMFDTGIAPDEDRDWGMKAPVAPPVAKSA
ncbi:methyl-accepting chemotaxis protein [Oceanicola sp. 22II-s10i]|uniref:methyl-accepting chemotaxis protein n=1 Tax=Oceanicola sp. 22II-s10i TaxID=1317116 RepID=UPI000B5262E5|nr:methyl-accepting chemotaxis protein [Oceanicola sp. 22II-s10i]